MALKPSGSLPTNLDLISWIDRDPQQIINTDLGLTHDEPMKVSIISVQNSLDASARQYVGRYEQLLQ
jgi:hypothetical protein